LTKNQGITVGPGGPDQCNLWGKKKDQEAPRYQIDFRGLDAYGIITEDIRAAIRRMIDRSKNAVFINHPRKYAISSLAADAACVDRR